MSKNIKKVKDLVTWISKTRVIEAERTDTLGRPHKWRDPWAFEEGHGKQGGS